MNKILKQSRLLLIICICGMISSCGLNPNDEGSCKKALCEGIWQPHSVDKTDEPSNVLYGAFKFRADGTCYNLCPNGRKIWGTWKLGGVTGIFRDINVVMSESLTNIEGGTLIDFSLSEDDHPLYLNISNRTTIGDGILKNWSYDDDNSTPTIGQNTVVSTPQTQSQPNIANSSNQQVQPIQKNTGVTDANAQNGNVTVIDSFGIATTIVERAYFYKMPDTATRRKAYNVKGEIVEYNGIKANFIYVTFINPQGVKTDGWMLVSDFSLQPGQKLKLTGKPD